MSTPLMTVRNLTSTPINVKHYEIHDLHHTLNGGESFSNITGLWSTPANAKPSRASLEDVSVLVEPFKACKANVKVANVPHQSLSVFLEIGGELYQTNILKPTCNSQILMPLTTDPHFNFTTVYHPEHHHLAIFYRDQTTSWMKNLKNETQISAISIPGTHNSPTYHRALPSVRCQVAPVREQLQQGVRFLDIRVQPENPLDPGKDGLVLVHGVFPISLSGKRYFRAVVDEVSLFLKQNPSETVIMSVKREGPGDATDAQLSRILRDHYAGDVNHWFTAPRIPTLGEARGKIVLIRRFALEDGLKNEWGGAGWCINADAWADNTPNALCPSGDICIQDFYEVTETEKIEEKTKYAIEHLERAACCACSGDKQPIFINFLTASNFWKQSCWPDKIAAKLNPAIVEYLCTRHHAPNTDGQEGSPVGDGSTGVVVCDWVGHEGNWDIVRCIIGMNARFEAKASVQETVQNTLT
jgi:1-phosphatidylinositol phosphodiesterase